ncbi:MAG: cytochrome c, partial [Alphaproteobacteria bacterium]
QSAAGKTVYKACADCHVDDGSGIPGLYPALAANANVNAHDPSSIIQIVIAGSGGPENPSPSGAGMAAFPKLTDKEVAAVATYVRSSWGNAAPAVSERDVAKIRGMLAKRTPVAAAK